MAGEKTDPFLKDPDAVLDYAVSWAAWLSGVSDTLSVSEWSIVTSTTVPPLVIDTDTSDDTTATVWLSGGLAGTKYALQNRITTAGGRVNDRTIYVKVKEL